MTMLPVGALPMRTPAAAAAKTVQLVVNEFMFYNLFQTLGYVLFVLHAYVS